MPTDWRQGHWGARWPPPVLSTRVSSHGSSYAGEVTTSTLKVKAIYLGTRQSDSAAEGASSATCFPEMQGQGMTQQHLPLA